MPKVGDKVWVFESNYRVYPKDKDGRSYGSPIYREHFRPQKIVGETRVSWLVGVSVHACRKAPKRDPRSAGVFLTEVEVDDACWDADHRYRIQRLVADRYKVRPEQLREIAKLVGYEEAS